MKQETYKSMKRFFDIIASLGALGIIWPVMLIAAIAIKLESKGPIVYRSKRVGQNYKVFGLLKFRTMSQDADTKVNVMKDLNQYKANITSAKELTECPFCKMLQRPCSPILINDDEHICENFYLMRKEKDKASAFFKISNDPRVTRVGNFLRKTSIDELPQLINILKGDMSLIGNRPLPLYEAEKLTNDHDIERFNAPSGLTGLWQVTKRGKSAVSEKERIELDKTYAREWSLAMDFKILMKTIPSLLQEENV